MMGWSKGQFILTHSFALLVHEAVITCTSLVRQLVHVPLTRARPIVIRIMVHVDWKRDGGSMLIRQEGRAWGRDEEVEGHTRDSVCVHGRTFVSVLLSLRR